MEVAAATVAVLRGPVVCQPQCYYWCSSLGLCAIAVLLCALALRSVLELHPTDPDRCCWLPGARLNIAHAALHCPRALPGRPALVWADEGRPRELRSVQLPELRAASEHAAACLATLFKPGKEDVAAVAVAVDWLLRLWLCTSAAMYMVRPAMGPGLSSIGLPKYQPAPLTRVPVTVVVV